MPISWDVSLLRISVFCTGNPTASDDLWRLLTGQQEAENRAAVPGGRRFSGKFAGGLLTLTNAGPRLDLVLQAADSESGELRLPAIEAWTSLRGPFTQMSIQLLSSLDVSIVRVAFGCVFLAKKDTLEDCYRELKELLKSVNVDPSKMRDLHYRVNWQRDSKVVPIKLNRLTTWASMRLSTTLLQITGDKVAVSGADGDQFAIRLECDHNTDAGNREPFEPSKLGSIFEELVKLAAENADKGEIIS
jgi:hypothetical protein